MLFTSTLRLQNPHSPSPPTFLHPWSTTPLPLKGCCRRRASWLELSAFLSSPYFDITTAAATWYKAPIFGEILAHLADCTYPIAHNRLAPHILGKYIVALEHPFGLTYPRLRSLSLRNKIREPIASIDVVQPSSQIDQVSRDNQ